VQVKTERMCFEGIYVRFKVYTPDSDVSCRVACIGSPIGDCESWDGLCERLSARGCLCVSCEMPGFGHTPVSAPQDNATRASIVWGILDEVEYSRGENGCSWHLVSHGSGCGTVMKMAQDYSTNVLSRVLISPVVDRFSSGLWGMLLHTKPGKKLLGAYYERATASTLRFKQKMEKLYGQSLSQERLDKLQKEFVRKNRFDTLLNLFEKGYRISPKAFKVTSPVMLFWGRQDAFGSCPDEKLLKKLQNVEVHYITSSHMCMETMPQEMSEFLGGWFSYAEGRQKAPSNNRK